MWLPAGGIRASQGTFSSLMRGRAIVQLTFGHFFLYNNLLVCINEPVCKGDSLLQGKSTDKDDR